MNIVRRNIVKSAERKYTNVLPVKVTSGNTLDIKRNIKRKNTKNNVSVSGSNIVLKSSGMSKFKYPFCDEVPAGNYFSKITDAMWVTTNTGKKAIRVHYVLKDFPTCYKLVNGLIPENSSVKKYFVKQDYPTNTTFYEELIDAIDEALNKCGQGIELEEFKGVTEHISLGYGKSDIGGFTERCPFDVDDFITMHQNLIDRYSATEIVEETVDEQETETFYEEAPEEYVEITKSNISSMNVSYEDDDFDDFLPEDEE